MVSPSRKRGRAHEPGDDAAATPPTISPPTAARSAHQRAWDSCAAWLRAHGGTVSPHVALDHAVDPATGCTLRGVRATVDLAPGTLAFKVRRRRFLPPHTLARDDGQSGRP